MKPTALIVSLVLLLTVVADLVCSLPTAENDPQQNSELLSDLKGPIEPRDINPSMFYVPATGLHIKAASNLSIYLPISDNCIDWLYIMAFTSGVPDGGSDGVHVVEMRVSGETRPITRPVTLPNLPGDEYFPHKGDLWKLNLQNDFHFTSCVQLHEIEYIAIEEHNNDGWNIDSIVTILRDDAGGAKYYQLATVDMDINRWIDGDGHYDHRRFELTLVI